MAEKEEQAGSGGQSILSAAMNKLPPKLIFTLLILALVLFTGILALAVYKGSAVDILGIKISPGSGSLSNGSNGTNSTVASLPTIRLNIRFDSDDVNLRDPKLQVTAYKQTLEGGPVMLPARKGVDPGGIYVDLEPPDLETPFFVVIQSPQGTWQTDPISLKHSYSTANRTSN